jgi:hypothetical protein
MKTPANRNKFKEHDKNQHRTKACMLGSACAHRGPSLHTQCGCWKFPLWRVAGTKVTNQVHPTTCKHHAITHLLTLPPRQCSADAADDERASGKGIVYIPRHSVRYMLKLLRTGWTSAKVYWRVRLCFALEGAGRLEFKQTYNFFYLWWFRGTEKGLGSADAL